MKNLNAVLAAGAAVAVSLAACGQREPNDTVTDFVRNAAQTDLLEIQVGKLAAGKSESAEVRKFAGMLVKDHVMVSKELQRIAQAKGVEVSQTLKPEKQRSLEKLQGMSGAEFDRAFTQEMVSGHEQAVQMFEEAAQSARDPEIKAFATEKLRTLRQHLKVAQALPGADNRGQEADREPS